MEERAMKKKRREEESQGKRLRDKNGEESPFTITGEDSEKGFFLGMGFRRKYYLAERFTTERSKKK